MKKREPKSKRNHNNAMPTGKRRNNGVRNMSRPYTFVTEYTAKDEHIRFYGYLKKLV